MKKQMNLANELKENNGITLIALVITIIVLLILAGVTINAITGNESAMEKAQQARSENEQADELDSIKLAVVDAVAKGDNGKVSKENLTKALEGLIDGGIEGGETNPWTVKGKITGKKYTITENGNVTEDPTPQGTPATAEALNKLIGEPVEGYTTASDSETGKWRLYYADETNEEVFLISTNVVDSNTAFGGDGGIPLKKTGSTEKYSGSDAISEYGQKYNAKWFPQINNEDISDKQPNFQATAYLCDPANWEKYKTGPATYAVGGPTYEVLIKSWNEAVKNELMNAQKAPEEELEVTKDGYNHKTPSYFWNNNPIKQDKLEGLYNNGKFYWLASPSSYDTNYVCYVDRSGYVSYGKYNNAFSGVRPLVSIPISKVQIEGNTVKIVP